MNWEDSAWLVRAGRFRSHYDYDNSLYVAATINATPTLRGFRRASVFFESLDLDRVANTSQKLRLLYKTKPKPNSFLPFL